MQEKFLQTSPRIIGEIKEKIAELAEYEISPQSSIANKFVKYMEVEADTHSAKIEEAEENVSKKRRKKGKKGKKNITNNLEQANRFAGRALLEGHDIDDNFIRKLAFNVDPIYFTFNELYSFDDDTNEYLANFRASVKNHKIHTNGSVRAGNSAYTPPYATKIPLEMKRFCNKLSWLLQQDGMASGMEAAFFSHLHLARIHPFDDGNGRTSRALQNAILRNIGLPPPIIYAGERREYYKHLENAMVAWRNRTGIKQHSSEEERDFYNYLAGKVSATLDQILDGISERR